MDSTMRMRLTAKRLKMWHSRCVGGIVGGMVGGMVGGGRVARLAGGIREPAERLLSE